jgi:hypothetical protein
MNSSINNAPANGWYLMYGRNIAHWWNKGCQYSVHGSIHFSKVFHSDVHVPDYEGAEELHWEVCKICESNLKKQ